MSIFGQGSAFGSNNNASSSGTGTSAFGSTGSAFGPTQPAATNNIFGSTSQAPAPAPAGNNGTGGGGLFGSNQTSVFGTPKPAEQPAQAVPSNFFSQAPTASATGGGLFGQPKPADVTAPKTTMFGAATNAAPAGASEAPKSSPFSGGGVFGQPAPAAAAPAATNSLAAAPPLGGGDSSAAPPKTNLFGGFGGGGASGGGGLFGQKPPAESAPAAPAAASTGFNLKPGASLFGSTPTSSSTAGASATAAPSATPSLFGATKPAENKDGGTAPAATTPGLSLFGASKPEEKKDAAAPATASSAFSLGAKPAASTTAAPATTSTLTAPANISVQPPSMLRGKTIEEIVNKWSTDLESQVREFNKFAGEVAVWDRALIENGNTLSAIISHVLAAERDQLEVGQALDSIEQHQRDLTATLDNYEKAAQELSGTSGRVVDKGPADMERDKNYMLATDLQVHLDDLSGSLTEMIDSVNSLSLPSDSLPSQDPMAQIAQILSSHLESLQWIDDAVRDVEGKVVAVEKMARDSGQGQSLGNGRARGFGVR